jgi:hypothetical protein
MTERDRDSHENDERTVRCPVEGCDSEQLARALHLHVRQSKGDGHGPRGEIPDDVSLDDAETVGTETVEMEYPTERDTEQEARLCPYCGQTFTGSHGVKIHLGQVAGRHNHPEDAADEHEPEDFPRVTVDDEENVVGVIGRKHGATDTEVESAIPADRVYEFIAELLADDRQAEAQRVRSRLLAGTTDTTLSPLSPAYEWIILEARSKTLREGLAAKLDADGVHIEWRGKTETLASDEVRDLAAKLEERSNRVNTLDDDLPVLIEWLRDAADVLDGEPDEERLFIEHLSREK